MKRLSKILWILSVAVVVIFIWFLVAFSLGQGYTVLDSSFQRSINPVPGRIDQVDENITGHLVVSLNPWLFPVSHVLGGDLIVYDWFCYVPPFHVGGASGGLHSPWFGSGGWTVDAGPLGVTVDPSKLAETLVSNELVKSFPAFFLLGLCVGYSTNRLAESYSKHRLRALAAEFPDLDPESRAKLDDGWTNNTALPPSSSY